LIVLHGFLSSSIFHYPNLKDLSEHYIVFCIDRLGLASLNRQIFSCENLEETIDYFLESFEKWRKNIGIEQKFILCGNSFACYIAS